MEDISNTNISVDVVDKEHEYNLWLQYSQTDYECAKYLNEAPMHPKPLNIICYHCQQAAEKAAKALVVYFGSQGGMAKNHDIEFQLNQVKNLVKENKGISIPKEILEIASDISIYASEPRYPKELIANEQDVEKALTDSRKIMDWVNSIIGR
ncbi:MAG: HEPN domain-containing protein [Lachnospiraceae bacterium]|nr:HEPN domain-containing protein [Lachnospiraceae bacterium]